MNPPAPPTSPIRTLRRPAMVFCSPFLSTATHSLCCTPDSNETQAPGNESSTDLPRVLRYPISISIAIAIAIVIAIVIASPLSLSPSPPSPLSSPLSLSFSFSFSRSPLPRCRYRYRCRCRYRSRSRSRCRLRVKDDGRATDADPCRIHPDNLLKCNKTAVYFFFLPVVSAQKGNAARPRHACLTMEISHGT